MVARVDVLASYVPTSLLRRLVDGGAPLRPSCEHLTGAALFADVSGSTPLAEHLARRGAAGVEDLTRVLNSYFSCIIGSVTEHGGDIAKFAGDGLVALWPIGGSRTDLPSTVRCAAQCGLSVQEALRTLPDVDGFRLTLRIGIGAGEILAMTLGGEGDRWEFLAAGPAVLESTGAQQEARPGDVVLSSTAVRLAGDAVAGDERGGGAIRLGAVRAPVPVARLERPVVTDAVEPLLLRFTPRALRARLVAGENQWFAELRRVTTMFVNLPDLDFVADFDGAQSVARALQRTLERFEGSLGRLGYDDKGPTLLVAWGLPPLAHEDDPARAARAALEIRASMTDMGHRCRIGISTGRAFCGAVGDAVRCEYTMIGDAINLAARLMQQPGDDVRCDAATQQLAQTRLDFEPLTPIQVRGKDAPVPVFRPWQVGTRPGRRAADLVDRESERDRLAERLQRLASASTGGVIAIEGEPGIGKSRLVQDLVERARAAGVIALVGGGDAVESSTPYHAWRSVFGQVFRVDVLPADAAVRRQIVLSHLRELFATGGAADAPDLAAVAPLLSSVLALEWPDSDVSAPLAGEARADATRDLLISILEQVAEAGPLLLVLEDAHWMDSASWALTRLVGQRVPRVLLVLATRSLADPPPQYRELLEAPDAMRIELAALPEAAALALVAQRLGAISLDQPVAAFILERAEGHPFFSEELAYALRDAGLIVVENGVCRTAARTGGLRSIDFPDTIEGVIISRIDRLTASQQLALKVASVIGRTFAFRTLRDVYPLDADPPNLEEDATTLGRLDLTVLLETEPELLYLFKHVITREVAYNLMLFGQRRQLHRSVAEWYERVYAADLAPHYPLLAHHWRNCFESARVEPELAARAIDYLERAGQQAANSHANQEAARFLLDALELDDQVRQAGNPLFPPAAPLRRARWERQVGEALFSLGRAPEATAHLERTLTLLGEPALPSGRRQVLMAAIEVVRQLRHRLVPLGLGRHTGERRDAIVEAANAYKTLAILCFVTMDKTGWTYRLLRSLNLAETAQPSAILAALENGLGHFLGMVGLRGAADGYFKRGLTAATAVDDPRAFGEIWYVRGWHLLGLGEWSAARDAFQRSIEQYEKLGDRRWIEQCWNNLGNALYLQGELASAIEQWDRVSASAVNRGDVEEGSLAAIWQAMARLLQGEHDEALRLLSSVEARVGEQFESLPDRAGAIVAHGTRALARFRRGERDQALEAAEAVAPMMVGTQALAYYAAFGFALVAELCARLRDLPPAGEGPAQERATLLGAQSRAALRAMARVMPIVRPQAWLWEGVSLAQDGKPKKALRTLRKSLAAAEQLGMPIERAFAQYEIGRLLPIDDPTREDQLGSAIGLFESLGAADHARAARLAGKP